MPTPRSRRLSRTVGAVALATAAVLAGCASKPDEGKLTDALVTSGLSKAEAKCAAEAIFEHLSDKQVEDFIERGASGIPTNDPARTDDTADQLNNALAKCRDEEAGRTPLPEEDGSTTTTSVETTTTVAPTTTQASLNTVPASTTTTAGN